MKDRLINILNLVKQFICNYQILSASIIVASAIIAHALFTRNNNRYHYHRHDHGWSGVFDSKTGELYVSNGERIINKINGKIIDKPKKSVSK